MKVSPINFIIIPLWIAGCTQRETGETTEIVWKDNKAVEVILSNPSILGLPEEKLNLIVRVELGESKTPMLGQIFKRNGNVVFQPAVPFSRGMHYHVLVNDLILTELDIPLDENAKTPELSIFPSADTFPENILKMYLRFSEPMVEGKSLRHIFVFNSDGDSLEGTFLDLQPELWNNEGTMLTLWFDPGRVKRDLIPNRELGNPLIKNQQYTLLVTGDWNSKSGKTIGRQTYKRFWVTSRDESTPDVNTWKIKPPFNNTLEAVVIDFSEPLDFSLIQTAFHIVNEAGDLIDGTIEPQKNENGIEFNPVQVWIKGAYVVRVEARLEDLAGNNLVRLFDRDVTKNESHQGKKFFEKKFRIQ